MEYWRVEASWAIGNSIAPGSKPDYGRALQHFEAFRAQVSCPQVWPIPVDQFLRYGIFLKESGLAVKLNKGRFSALAFTSKTTGHKDKSGDFSVHKMLDGWAMEIPSLAD